MQKKTKYFSDLYIFINFIIQNKLIFIISLLIILFFTAITFILNYNKYLNSFENYAYIEISFLELDDQDNQNLKKIYSTRPLIDFTNNKFKILTMYDEFKKELKDYLVNNNIIFKKIIDNKKFVSFELLVHGEDDSVLISEDNILNIYETNKNELINKIQNEIDNQYFLLTTDIFEQIVDFTFNFDADLKKYAKEAYRRLGAKYTLNHLCELHEITHINLSDETKFFCKDQINEFKDLSCSIIPKKISVKNLIASLIFSQEKCPGGIYVDKNKTFKEINDYLNLIMDTNYINVNFKNFKRAKKLKPKIEVYLISWLIFSSFFGLIFTFLHRSLQKIIK